MSNSSAEEKSFKKKLEAAARHLRCAPNESAVIWSCKERADDRCNAIDEALTPADRLLVMADQCSVHFEVAGTNKELDEIVARYARRGEPGFAARREQFDDTLLAAILRRQNPSEGDRTFVALIDARGSKDAMAFFSKAHEVAHPVLEPQLAFDFRDETKKRDRWESLVDRVGAEMVFSGSSWAGAVAQRCPAGQGVTIGALAELREEMARDASLTAVALATANQAGRAALVVWAGEETSQRDPVPTLRVLRSTPNAFASEVGTYLHRKRRVPDSSPIARAHRSRGAVSDFENLSDWRDGDGHGLPARRIWTAAKSMGSNVLALIDFGPGGSWR